MSKPFFNIEARIVGEDFPPLIIPEIGINHNGSFSKAKLLIDAAKKANSEIVKFQCHIIEKEMIKTDIKPGNSNKKIWDIINKAQLTHNEEKRIQKYTINKKMIFISTPFSREAADRLEEMGVSSFKIGSGECNNLPLVEHIAKKKKPIILSTGMNDLDSIKTSVNIIRKYDCPIAILHCTSMYPTPYKHVRLGNLAILRKKFPFAVIGLSDHSLGIETSLGAVALGASIIEKHFTISKKWSGPDNIISITPSELKLLNHQSKNIWDSLTTDFSVLKEEKPVINFAYASVVSTKKIKKNETFTYKNLWVKRPGNGKLLSKDLKYIIGKKASRYIMADKQIYPEDIENFFKKNKKKKK